MKKKFKYLLGALVLCAGVTACSSNNEENDQSTVTSGPKDVAVKILRSSTYAVDGTAVDVTPDIKDAVVYFISEEGNIVMKGEMNDTETAAGQKVFQNVPGAAKEVFIVGNPSLCGSPTLPNVSTAPTKVDLMKVMFDQTKQTNAKTAVNLVGTGNIDKSDPANPKASVEVSPAISRIEIKEVKAKTGATVTIPLTDFKLAGIFINNTYLQLGMNYTTKPNGAGADALIVNYGTGDAAAFTGNDFKTKASSLCDVFPAPVSDNSFTAGADKFWSYFVLPPTAAAGGTVLNGAPAGDPSQLAVPHIILHIKDAQATGWTLPADAFATITRFRDKGGSNALIAAFEAGKVYRLTDAIEIGGEHLSATPETPTSADLTVSVTVKKWIDANVKPDL